MSTSGTLPSPGAVPDRAADLAAATADRAADPASVNVHVAPVDGGFDPATVELDGDAGGYEGSNAGDLGRLAAAAAAVETLGAGGNEGRSGADENRSTDPACLHYPDAAVPAAGPWLVVEPLEGRLSTVHAGRGRLAVELTGPPSGVDAGLRAVRNALADVLEGVRPAHEYYPVERDGAGVFTRGMTTLSLAGVDVDEEGITVRFDVSTTPDTRADAVESLVSDLACVRGARYELVTDLARSEPPSSLLRAAEAATERAVGDWEYEWYPRPTPFSRLPTTAKLALGTGSPGDETFDGATYEDCLAMLHGTIERYGGP